MTYSIPKIVRNVIRPSKNTTQPNSIQPNTSKPNQTQPTNSMELSTTQEATSCAVTQHLTNILWNPKVHYRFHKSPPMVSILSQTDPVHATPTYLSKIHLNIINSPMYFSSYWYLSFSLSHQYPSCHPILPICATRHAHLILNLYFVKGTSYEALHCAVFSIMSLHISSVQI
jgi:hypothetical protein